MIEQITVDHVTISTKRSFDEVVNAFESLVGSAEIDGLSSMAERATDKADFEKRVTATLGSSGLTRFITFDHGQWAALEGHPHKMRMYVIGNPLIAITMIRHDIGAGLDVPVRVAIYETTNGETRFMYNKPSTLMSGLKNAALHEAALKLDAKLLALAESSTGARA
ncbi:DUF302 domain-containing protein [Paraburkholderia solisilvae]|uniref:DUF302 domain-containing protein n=1 Tax=Paraburkholderia solisilvae TaxID=624376 RepID=A0A6J5DCG6_9BURK|nr:DUF302 domain-containing protein [Paraburkholderia solisilvae]CAB3751663.1 hypothetical protein LMG29739_01351 [Paraburkholderia solisilvae]